ncbi:MAG: hydroxymyristoyl-ACP dehydratase [Caldimonas sp.]
MKPTQLDHAGIEARVPHRGTMCLLDRMVAWDDVRIECLASDHRDPAHPLRSRSGLMAGTAIEYAAQAAALHGGLLAEASGRAAPPGYLASARDVRLGAWRLDDLPATESDLLRIVAERKAGDAGRLLYAFRIEHAGREIASGRLAVVLHAGIGE